MVTRLRLPESGAYYPGARKKLNFCSCSRNYLREYSLRDRPGRKHAVLILSCRLGLEEGAPFLLTQSSANFGIAGSLAAARAYYGIIARSPTG